MAPDRKASSSPKPAQQPKWPTARRSVHFAFSPIPAQTNPQPSFLFPPHPPLSPSYLPVHLSVLFSTFAPSLFLLFSFFFPFSLSLVQVHPWHLPPARRKKKSQKCTGVLGKRKKRVIISDGVPPLRIGPLIPSSPETLLSSLVLKFAFFSFTLTTTHSPHPSSRLSGPVVAVRIPSLRRLT